MCRTAEASCRVSTETASRAPRFVDAHGSSPWAEGPRDEPGHVDWVNRLAKEYGQVCRPAFPQEHHGIRLIRTFPRRPSRSRANFIASSEFSASFRGLDRRVDHLARKRELPNAPDKHSVRRSGKSSGRDPAGGGSRGCVICPVDDPGHLNGTHKLISRPGCAVIPHHNRSPLNVTMPSAAKTIAAMIRMALTGSLPASLSPMITAGILASIIPKVVPATTA
jgi:hypothetical protein